MLVAEGAVESRVLSRQGKSIREIARILEGLMVGALGTPLLG
jgi:hypothetical protein